MVILEAENRILTNGQKYTYTSTNYASGVSSITVLNATDSVFATNAYLLLGNFGSENAEIVQISTVNSTTGVITLTATTKFAHPESTRVTILPYNQVRFFHTTTTTYGTDTPLTGYIDIQPSDWFTSYSDETYSSGYGWYIFYNPTTSLVSVQSNYIPYTGFDSDMTEDILDSFFSMLSNKDLSQISRDDALSWASEGYSKMKNKLNLGNVEFSASAVSTISITSGTIEYDLPSDFDHLIALASGLDTTDPGAIVGSKNKIDFISLANAYTYNGTETRYYIRGTKIGFLPTPSTSTTYHYLYSKRASRLSLNTDEVVLPNGMEYALKDYMLYRAYQKLKDRVSSKEHRDAFENGLNDAIIASIKRDADRTSWSVDPYANV